MDPNTVISITDCGVGNGFTNIYMYIFIGQDWLSAIRKPVQEHTAVPT